MNPGSGAWYLSFVIDNDAIAFSPDYKFSTFDINENGGTMVIYSHYYKIYNDLNPVAVYTATITWGTGGPSTGVEAVEIKNNSNVATFNLAGMKTKSGRGLIIRGGKKYLSK